MSTYRKPRLGAAASIAVRRRGGAGKHLDRRTKRVRTRNASRTASIREQS